MHVVVVDRSSSSSSSNWHIDMDHKDRRTVEFGCWLCHSHDEQNTPVLWSIAARNFDITLTQTDVTNVCSRIPIPNANAIHYRVGHMTEVTTLDRFNW